MKKVTGLILTMVLLLSSQGRAQEDIDIRPLSPGSASTYSLLGTLIPGALCAASLVMAGSEENSGEDNTEALMFMTGLVGLWFGPGIGYLCPREFRQFRLESFDFGGVSEPVDHDIGPLPGKRQGDTPADTACGTCDKG